jgi:hypothetical protein
LIGSQPSLSRSRTSCELAQHTELRLRLAGTVREPEVQLERVVAVRVLVAQVVVVAVVPRDPAAGAGEQ